jgi:hypothetical protein
MLVCDIPTAALMTLQNESSTAIALPIQSSQPSAPLGWILLRNKLISPSQLALALIMQHQSHKQLGELLLEQRLISDEQLEQVLREQYWRRKGYWVI